MRRESKRRRDFLRTMLGGETACYRAVILVRQDASANLDGDTILKYDRERDRFFQSPDPRLDEQIWTSPVWVTRESTWRSVVEVLREREGEILRQ